MSKLVSEPVTQYRTHATQQGQTSQRTLCTCSLCRPCSLPDLNTCGLNSRRFLPSEGQKNHSIISSIRNIRDFIMQTRHSTMQTRHYIMPARHYLSIELAKPSNSVFASDGKEGLNNASSLSADAVQLTSTIVSIAWTPYSRAELHIICR